MDKCTDRTVQILFINDTFTHYVQKTRRCKIKDTHTHAYTSTRTHTHTHSYLDSIYHWVYDCSPLFPDLLPVALNLWVIGFLMTSAFPHISHHGYLPSQASFEKSH